MDTYCIYIKKTDSKLINFTRVSVLVGIWNYTNKVNSNYEETSINYGITSVTWNLWYKT